MCHKVTQKVVKKLSKKSLRSCQKAVKSCQKAVKKLSKRCPTHELFWPNIGKTIGQTLKTKTQKPGKFERNVRRIENRQRMVPSYDESRHP
jgi:superoxide dismutase